MDLLLKKKKAEESVLEDKDLARRIKRGDDLAFSELVQKYERRIRSTAIGIIRNKEEAEEVAQEVFIRIYRHIDSYIEDCPLYTWMHKITYNLCIDFYRRTKRRKLVDLGFDESGESITVEDIEGRLGEVEWHTNFRQPESEIDGKKVRETIAESLECLSPAHRMAITLRDVEEFSYQEIAEIMECNVGTVMSRIFHARKNLQALLTSRLGAAYLPSGSKVEVRNSAAKEAVI